MLVDNICVVWVGEILIPAVEDVDVGLDDSIVVGWVVEILVLDWEVVVCSVDDADVTVIVADVAAVVAVAMDTLHLSLQ